MTFADIPAAVAVFLDTNTLIYHFTNDARFGAACTHLLERIENKEIDGVISAHGLAEMSHRLMALEASTRFNWPYQGIATRLKNHPAEVRQLARHRQAIDELPLLGVRVLDVTRSDVSLAADVSQQTALLCGDALIVVAMQTNGWTHLASHDGDFDRVPGITRYDPV